MIATLELIALAVLPTFLLLDLISRHRKYRNSRYWRLRATLVTGASFVLAIEIATFWAGVFGDFTIFNGQALGTVGGAIVGILGYQFVHYWYHRAVHRSDVLFQRIHQMHHSAESLDAFGAYYLHPVDTALFTTWSSLILFPVLGLSAQAGAITALFIAFNAVFQHANISTPQWLGYLIQRPESHGVHHQRGLHRYNYCDLPLWDMLFGTFRNPRTFSAEVGFDDDASTRLGAMLIGVDVSGANAAAPSSTVVPNRVQPGLR